MRGSKTWTQDARLILLGLASVLIVAIFFPPIWAGCLLWMALRWIVRGLRSAGEAAIEFVDDVKR